MTIQQQLEHWQDRISKLLTESLPSDGTSPQSLHQAMRYGALNGGKRIRPTLVYITGQALGAELSDLDSPALAVELIHCYSLVQDRKSVV